MNENKKNILVVMQASDLDNIYLSTGGVDTVCKTLLNGYRTHQSNDYNYTFLVFDPLNQVQNTKKIKIWEYDCYIINFKDSGLIKLPTFIYQIYKVHRYIKITNPDIVHCHQDSWITGTLFSGVNRIVTLHGYREICRKKIGIVNDFIYERLLPTISDSIVDKYTCVSHTFCKNMPAAVSKKTRIVYNPLSQTFYDKGWAKFYSDPTLVFVGLVIPRKNIELCIEVLKKSREKGVNARLVIVGPQPDALYREKLENLISDYALKRYVNFSGHLDAKDINELYNKSHFGLSFSQEETFGLVPLEMYQSGLEVFCYRVGVLQDKNISSNFSESLHLYDLSDTSVADVVSDIILDSANREQNTRQENQKVDIFSVDSIIKAYEKEYNI